MYSKSKDNWLVIETCSLRDREETWNLRDGGDSQKWVSRPRPSLKTPSLASAVVLNLVYISHPFIKQSYPIYPNITRNGVHLL